MLINCIARKALSFLAGIAIWVSLSSHALSAEIVIYNVHVIPMDREEILFDHIVRVDDGLIVEVSPQKDFQLQEGQIAIDGEGGYLMPGLVDMSVRLKRQDAETVLVDFLLEGVTTIRNFTGSSRVLEWKERTENGLLPGPNIISSGPEIGQFGFLNPFLFRPSGRSISENWQIRVRIPSEVEDVVARIAEDGYDFLSIEEDRQLQDIVFEEILRISEEIELFTAGGKSNLSLADALSFGLDEITKYPPVWKAERGNQPFSDHEIELMREKGTCFTTKLTRFANGIDWQRSGPRIFERYEYSRIGAQEKSLIQRRLESWSSNLRNTPERISRNQDAAIRATQQLADSSVLLTASSGYLSAYSGGVATPGHLHRELELLQEHLGLGAFEVLEVVTRNPGSCTQRMGNQADFGRITPGMRADLILLKGNPLTDLTQTRAPLGIMVAGNWYDRNELEGTR